jgi:hypothetical protein
VQIDIFNRRSCGALPVPPRTLVQQNTIIQQNVTNVTNVTNNNTTNIVNNTTNVNRTTNNVNRTTNAYNTPVLGTTSKVMAAKGVKTVPIDSATRVQAKQQAAAVQQVAFQRTATEQPLPPGAPRQARVASLSVPKAQAVQPGFVAPRVSQQAMNQARAGQPLRPATAPAHPSANPPGLSSPRTLPSATGTSPHAAHPGYVPGSANARPQPPVGQPPRAMPKSPMNRPTVRPSQPPARRPPPNDSKEHH